MEACDADVARELALELAEQYDPKEPFKDVPGLDMTVADFSRELLARFGSAELLEFARGAAPDVSSYLDIAALWSLPEPLRQEETLRRLAATGTHLKQVGVLSGVNHMDLSSQAVRDLLVSIYGTVKYDASRLSMLWNLGHNQHFGYPAAYFHAKPRDLRPAATFPEWLSLHEEQLAARRQVLEALQPRLKSPQEQAAWADSQKGLDAQKAKLESSAKTWRSLGKQ